MLFTCIGMVVICNKWRCNCESWNPSCHSDFVRYVIAVRPEYKAVVYMYIHASCCHGNHNQPYIWLNEDLLLQMLWWIGLYWSLLSALICFIKHGQVCELFLCFTPLILLRYRMGCNCVMCLLLWPLCTCKLHTWSCIVLCNTSIWLCPFFTR